MYGSPPLTTAVYGAQAHAARLRPAHRGSQSNWRPRQSDSSQVQSLSTADPFVYNKPSRIVPLGTLAETHHGVHSNSGANHLDRYRKVAAFLATHIKPGVHGELQSDHATWTAVAYGAQAPTACLLLARRGSQVIRRPEQPNSPHVHSPSTTVRSGMVSLANGILGRQP